MGGRGEGGGATHLSFILLKDAAAALSRPEYVLEARLAFRGWFIFISLHEHSLLHARAAPPSPQSQNKILFESPLRELQGSLGSASTASPIVTHTTMSAASPPPGGLHLRIVSKGGAGSPSAAPISRKSKFFFVAPAPTRVNRSRFSGPNCNAAFTHLFLLSPSTYRGCLAHD